MACKKDPDWNTIVEPQSTSNVDNRSCYPYMNLYSSELHIRIRSEEHTSELQSH